MKRLLFKKKDLQPVVQHKLPPLALCLLMDFLGFAFLAIPILGPFIEAIFAPVSAFIYMRMFGFGLRGIFGGIFNFIEELIPGMDLIPTFTITWFLQYARHNKQAQHLRTINR